MVLYSRDGVLMIDQAKAWDTDTLATLGTLAMLGLHTVYTVWWGYVWCGPRLLFVSLSVGLNLLLDGSIVHTFHIISSLGWHYLEKMRFTQIILKPINKIDPQHFSRLNILLILFLFPGNPLLMIEADNGCMILHIP